MKTSLRHIRGIVFDKDGTLLDFERTWTPVLKELALKAAGGNRTRAAELLDAGGLAPTTGKFRSGSVIGADTTKRIVHLWYPNLSGADFVAEVESMNRAFVAHGASHAVPLDGVAAALDVLGSRGYIMGVATNDSSEAAQASLAMTGMLRNLPYIFGYDSVSRPKPAPDMVLAFCKAAQIPPAQVVVVGDNRHDLQMARSAGAAMAIGVTSGTGSADDLAGLADAIIPSVHELPALLERRFGRQRALHDNPH